MGSIIVSQIKSLSLREKVKSIINNVGLDEITIKQFRKILEGWLTMSFLDLNDAIFSTVMELLQQTKKDPSCRLMSPINKSSWHRSK
mmetsp:Transcript_6675/g.11677  ORF Transcript_6675/g.11677 Transcript_6675/m.11677 type:complete len:87 (-) Transcript_6675:125-385(-)